MLIVCGCSGGDPSTTSSGGSAGSPQGGLIGAGGAVGSGGVLVSGGATGSGGASPAAGGAITTGGASGLGGALASGGVIGSGGASAGSGGAGAGAAGKSSGGSSNGSSGGAASGGAASGGANQGGVGGAVTAGAGGTAGNDTAIAGSFDGALVTYPCGAAHSGFDCDNVGCTNGQVTHTKTFQLGGVSGSVYELTFRVRGIVEAYNYVGGTRDAGNASITSNLDLFLRGGAPQPSGASGYDYDVYELDVSPAVAGAPSTYFLNSVTNAENPHTSSATLHLSFAIDYTKTIRVPGGGTITLKQFDSNCKSVMNCGKTAGSSCAAPRSVSLSDAMPAAPTSFTQPYQMPTGAYGQWLFFDVTNVAAAP